MTGLFDADFADLSVMCDANLKRQICFLQSLDREIVLYRTLQHTNVLWTGGRISAGSVHYSTVLTHD